MLSAMYMTLTQVDVLLRLTKQVTDAAEITFKPILLLEVAFPQSSGSEVLVHAGLQLPRNGARYRTIAFRSDLLS